MVQAGRSAGDGTASRPGPACHPVHTRGGARAVALDADDRRSAVVRAGRAGYAALLLLRGVRPLRPGAAALAGLLARDPGRFERVVLVVPPGDLRPPPLSYRLWLDSLPTAASGPPAPNTEFLVLGLRGDRGHPARAAEEWAGRLGARLEIFTGRGTVPQRELMPSAVSRSPERIWGDLVPGYELMRSAATEFLNA
jgi:hypothetical protein